MSHVMKTSLYRVCTPKSPLTPHQTGKSTFWGFSCVCQHCELLFSMWPLYVCVCVNVYVCVWVWLAQWVGTAYRIAFHKHYNMITLNGCHGHEKLRELWWWSRWDVCFWNNNVDFERGFIVRSTHWLAWCGVVWWCFQKGVWCFWKAPANISGITATEKS